jgi:hypothetical protein
MKTDTDKYEQRKQKEKVIGLSSSKTVSGSHALPPKWLPQCSCIVIESSFDPGERLQAPGSLLFIGCTGFLCLFVFVLLCIFFVVLFFSPNQLIENRDRRRKHKKRPT